jgi:chromosome segregation ATPase
MKNLSELEAEIMKICQNNERDYEQTAKVLREYEDVVSELSNALKTQLEEQEKKVNNLIQQLKKQKEIKKAVEKNKSDLEFKKMSFDYLRNQLLHQ